jgi:hypothetical protein
MANMKIRVSAIYRFLYYLLILGLICFGTGFSKFHVIGPLYLHDLVLLIATIAVLISPPAKLPFLPVLIVSAISLLYLIVSLFTSTAPFTIIIRQYAIFGYMICYYLLYLKSFRGSDHELEVKFLIRTGILCLGIQAIFILYRFVNGLSILADYNYFTPITVLGIVVAATYFLVFIDNLFYKVCFFGLALVLSLSTGHSSAFLSVFTVGAFYLFFRSTHISKMIIIVLIVLAVFSLYIFLPQFQDVNAGWRLITWEYTISNMVNQNFGLIGEGFGVPYFDDYLINKLFVEVGGTGFFGPANVDEPYLSSVHNSYLTICFSIGLLPGLLILYPFYKMFFYLATRRYKGTREADFLFLSLIGLSVWVSFNQILEVPHSTGLFWLVYFASLSVPTRDELSTTPDLEK